MLSRIIWINFLIRQNQCYNCCVVLVNHTDAQFECSDCNKIVTQWIRSVVFTTPYISLRKILFACVVFNCFNHSFQ